MSNAKIRLIVVLGALSVTLMVLSQYIYLKKAFDVKEKNFNQAVQIALREVAVKMADYNRTPLAVDNPVNRLSSDYYVVHFNDHIDANVLEHYLTSTLGKYNLHLDFEYGIYDCSSDNMVYGAYVNLDSNYTRTPDNEALRKYDQYEYYFGVHFPTRTFFIGNRLTLWIISSVLLLLVVGFFGYTLFIVLNQKRLSEVQKDFINNMTHEFKTPLSTISIAADVLAQPGIEAQKERFANYVAIIKNQSERLTSQVEKVLQMVVIEKKEENYKFEEVEIVAALKEIVVNFRPKVQEKGGGISLETSLGEATIHADTLHFNNIVYNIIDNGIKYCRTAPTIELRLTKEDGSLWLSVVDNGIGIEKKHIKRIFDKFFRVPTGNIHDVKGFGIGLNYVKQVVKAHHWEIAAQSEPGQGSTFTIRIPIKTTRQ